jgi:hypothetical protein
MSKLRDFLENKGHILMQIFIGIQIAMFIVFSVLLFIADSNNPIENNIFLCLSHVIFFCFMGHFAYHSVTLKTNKDSQSILLGTHIIHNNVNTLINIYNIQLLQNCITHKQKPGKIALTYRVFMPVE